MTEQEVLDARLTYYCQPVYDCRTGCTSKGELLLRAYGPDGEFYPTQEFIQAAEAHGLIAGLDLQALRHACGILRRHHGSSVTQLGVNFSAVSCRIPDFARQADAILREYRDVCERLVVEVTETAPGDRDPQMQDTLERVRRSGALIAIDDFGKDHAGITRILDLPFDYLKLDKWLVERCGREQMAEVVTRCLVAAMNEAYKSVVAEGVETLEQARQMERMGVRYLQGYYYSPPVPEKEFLSELERRHPEGREAKPPGKGRGGRWKQHLQVQSIRDREKYAERGVLLWEKH